MYIARLEIDAICKSILEYTSNTYYAIALFVHPVMLIQIAFGAHRVTYFLMHRRMGKEFAS